MSNNLSYRINTKVGENETSYSIDFPISQTYNTLDVLSLKLNQINNYNVHSSDTGIVVGRVLAGSKDFGIPNAKISIFIPYNSNDNIKNILYNYETVSSVGNDGVRYNLLPNDIDEICHQDVGSLYNKSYLLDNKDIIEVFDKYYKYTTITNNSGDYMIYGIPIGEQTLHVDIDLSDIGILSQAPRDMINKGYNIEQFESPSKFKKSKDLEQLSQIYTQNKGIYVYPFWGDTTDNNGDASITRCDIRINYEFEPTCVFMGSIVTDGKENSISRKCIADDDLGRMSKLVTGEGRIEMIRKTTDDKVQEFNIKGGNLIDGNGTWCYQIPMNLDFVRMDEYGNIVPTDNPSKGIPTRTRVRFRITLDEDINDNNPVKRASFLVPNNPRIDNKRYPIFTKDSSHTPDYEFGTFTKDEDFCDMFMNKVYTIKSYIPRLQKNISPTKYKYIGIKSVNHYGSNNPIPYNNIQIRFNFIYRFLCVIAKVFINVVYFLNNTVFGPVSGFFYDWGNKFGSWTFFKGLGEDLKTICHNIANAFKCIEVSGLCDDGNVYHPGCNDSRARKMIPSSSLSSKELLMNCLENDLAEENEIISFNFHNDWINGLLYAPTWHRKIKIKRKVFFNLIPVKAKDKFCSADLESKLKMYEPCALRREIVKNDDNNGHRLKSLPDTNNVNFLGKLMKYGQRNRDNGSGYKCHNRSIGIMKIDKGIIKRKKTKNDVDVFYYKPIEYDNNGITPPPEANVYEKKFQIFESSNSNNHDITNIRGFNKGGDYIKILFATDIVLLGSLNKNDKDGATQFFKNLTSTTYQLPDSLLTENYVPEKKDGYDLAFNDDNENVDEGKNFENSEITGADWGNHGYDQNFGNEYHSFVNGGKSSKKFNTEILDDGGLFYGLSCNYSFVKPKSCINLKRTCEYGIDLDRTLEVFEVDKNNNQISTKLLVADGYISYDEQINIDERSMFATMNNNNLKTKIDKNTGYRIYDFDYLYIDNFDGSLKNLMENPHGGNGLKNGGGSWGKIYSQSTPPSYRYNYALENNNSDYLRFRYGENIYYYQPKDHYDILLDGKSKGKTTFENTIPRFENSFYFYFGLIPGKSAIDRFKTLYYSECKEDAPETPVININTEPNSWCTNGRVNEDIELNDGRVTINTKGIVKPYDLFIYPLNSDSTHECFSKNINTDKIYIGNEESIDDYKKVVLSSSFDPDIKINSLNNGEYLFVFKDSFGNEYEEKVDFDNSTLDFIVETTDFKQNNEDLQLLFENYDNICNQLYDGDNPTDREIGGFITISNITNNGYPMGGPSQDSYMISVEAENPVNFNDNGMGTYKGTYFVPFEIYENTSLNGLPVKVPYPYSGNSTDVVGILYLTSFYNKDSNRTQLTTGSLVGTTLDRKIVIGVPKGDVRYKVTVTQLCQTDKCICESQLNYRQWIDSLTKNSLSKTVYISSPVKSRMLINDSNYDFIKNFDTGWYSKLYDLGPFKINRLFQIFFIPNNNFDRTIAINEWINKYHITNPPLEKLQCTKYSTYNDIKEYINALSPDKTLIFVDDETILNEDYSKRHKYVKIIDKSNNLPLYKKFSSTTFVQMTKSDLDNLCFFNWPISYCYIPNFNENEFNLMTNDEKKKIADDINSILLERLKVSFQLKASMSIQDPTSGMEIKLDVEPEPLFNEHTRLIYYIEDNIDENETPNFVSNKDYQFTTESKTGEFYLPTITKDENYKYTFFSKNDTYKTPYYLACRCKDGTLLPNTMKLEYFNPYNAPFGSMFGFHTILRPAGIHISSWSFNKLLLTINCTKNSSGNDEYIEDSSQIKEFTLFSLGVDNCNEEYEKRIYFTSNGEEECISLPIFKRQSINDKALKIENPLNYQTCLKLEMSVMNSDNRKLLEDNTEWKDHSFSEPEVGTYRELSYSPYYKWDGTIYENISYNEIPNTSKIIVISELGYYDKVKSNIPFNNTDTIETITAGSGNSLYQNIDNDFMSSVVNKGNTNETIYYKVMNGLAVTDSRDPDYVKIEDYKKYKNIKRTEEVDDKIIFKIFKTTTSQYEFKYGVTPLTPIPFGVEKLYIKDMNNTLYTENVYANMEIITNGNGITGEKNYIDVSTLGCNKNDVNYYLFPINGTGTKFEYPIDGKLKNWKNNGIISALYIEGIQDDDFFNLYENFENIKGAIKPVSNDNMVHFEFEKEVTEFFIIAVTGNGCKALSPIYYISNNLGSVTIGSDNNANITINNPNIYLKKSITFGNSVQAKKYEQYPFKSKLIFDLQKTSGENSNKEVKKLEFNNVIIEKDLSTEDKYICNSYMEYDLLNDTYVKKNIKFEEKGFTIENIYLKDISGILHKLNINKNE